MSPPVGINRVPQRPINNIYSYVYHSATGTLNSESVFAFSSGSAGLIRTVV